MKQYIRSVLSYFALFFLTAALLHWGLLTGTGKTCLFSTFQGSSSYHCLFPYQYIAVLCISAALFVPLWITQYYHTSWTKKYGMLLITLVLIGILSSILGGILWATHEVVVVGSHRGMGWPAFYLFEIQNTFRYAWIILLRSFPVNIIALGLFVFFVQFLQSVTFQKTIRETLSPVILPFKNPHFFIKDFLQGAYLCFILGLFTSFIIFFSALSFFELHIPNSYSTPPLLLILTFITLLSLFYGLCISLGHEAIAKMQGPEKRNTIILFLLCILVVAFFISLLLVRPHFFLLIYPPLLPKILLFCSVPGIIAYIAFGYHLTTQLLSKPAAAPYHWLHITSIILPFIVTLFFFPFYLFWMVYHIHSLYIDLLVNHREFNIRIPYLLFVLNLYGGFIGIIGIWTLLFKKSFPTLTQKVLICISLLFCILSKIYEIYAYIGFSLFHIFLVAALILIITALIGIKVKVFPPLKPSLDHTDQ